MEGSASGQSQLARSTDDYSLQSLSTAYEVLKSNLHFLVKEEDYLWVGSVNNIDSSPFLSAQKTAKVNPEKLRSKYGAKNGNIVLTY